jgi:hypothetical protein
LIPILIWILRQLTTKKRKLAADLLDIQKRVVVLSDRYDTLATSSGDLAHDGINLADEMMGLIDYILAHKGKGSELRQRLDEVVNKSNILSLRARTLQNNFTMLNESLEGFRQCLEETRLGLEKKKKNQNWREKIVDFTMKLLAALTIAMGVVGVIMSVVATGPVGIVIGAGLLTAAAVTETLTESVEKLIALLNDGGWSKIYFGTLYPLPKQCLTLTGKSKEDSRLDQVIHVISNMERDMQKITQHVAGLEAFYSSQGDKLSSFTIQDRRIRFSGGKFETEKLRTSKQNWQEVKAGFEAYRGQVISKVSLHISSLIVTRLLQAYSWTHNNGHHQGVNENIVDLSHNLSFT